jgi:NTE family protein
VKRALVLGGGGVIGVAWETGLVAGLLEGGVDLREADVIVGTSAGSIIGTRLAAGDDLRMDLPRRGEERDVAVPLPEGGLDLPVVTEIFRIWSRAGAMDETTCAQIGDLASRARTTSEESWIRSITSNIGVDSWPDRELRITAVDVASGAFEVHTRRTGASLHAAVASSCAVPGMFPPVRVGRRSFMDGGVRSGTSADVVLDQEPDLSLIIAPICTATAIIGAAAERSLDDEVAQLRAAGSQVVTVLPGEAEVEAFGGNLMDPANAGAARAAGHARGLDLARGEAEGWLG